MQTVLLVIHLLIAVALVGSVLLQKSEGGALGMGGGGMSGFMTGRSTANLLTRTTAILAALFFATSIVLVLIASHRTPSRSLIEAPATSGPAAPVPALPTPGEPARRPPPRPRPQPNPARRRPNSGRPRSGAPRGSRPARLWSRHWSDREGWAAARRDGWRCHGASAWKSATSHPCGGGAL